MNKLAMILFFTFIGTVANASSFETPLEFAKYHCSYADESENCVEKLEQDPATQTMNRYSLVLRVCAESNISRAPKQSTCLASAARALRDREFTKDVTDCRNDENFLGTGPKNETWAEVVKCQTKLFAKRAAKIDREGKTDDKDGKSRHTRK